MIYKNSSPPSSTIVKPWAEEYPILLRRVRDFAQIKGDGKIDNSTILINPIHGELFLPTHLPFGTTSKIGILLSNPIDILELYF